MDPETAALGSLPLTLARAKSAASTPPTDSPNVTVHERLEAFVGLLAARLIEVTVGAVRSIVTAGAEAATVGPVFPAASVTVPALRVSVTEPALQPVRVIV